MIPCFKVFVQQFNGRLFFLLFCFFFSNLCFRRWIVNETNSLTRWLESNWSFNHRQLQVDGVHRMDHQYQQIFINDRQMTEQDGTSIIMNNSYSFGWYIMNRNARVGSIDSLPPSELYHLFMYSVYIRVVWCQWGAIDTFIVGIEAKMIFIPPRKPIALWLSFIIIKPKVLNVFKSWLFFMQRVCSRTFVIYLVLRFQTEFSDSKPRVVVERCHRSWSFHQTFNPPLVSLSLLPSHRLGSPVDQVLRTHRRILQPDSFSRFHLFEEMKLTLSWIFCYIDWHISLISM